MKKYKIYLTAICAIFLIVSCGTYKKTKEYTSVEKTSKESSVSIKDSIVNVNKIEIIKKDSIVIIEKTAPTESVVVLDLDELTGDFTQSTSSGEGSGTTIRKVGNKLIVTTRSAGSVVKETTVEKSDSKEVEIDTKIKETTDHEKIDSSVTVSEKETKIVRTPFLYKFFIWIFILILLIVIFRKKIFKIVSTMFPGMKVAGWLLKILT